jgi:hypothetical protein
MDMHYGQEVSVLIRQDPLVVESRISDVESWSTFLSEVDNITKVAHERYDFEIDNGHGCRSVRVVVHRDPRRHSFIWTALTGATFDGVLQLDSVDGGWTRATVRLASLPDGFRAGLADLVMPPTRRTGIDEGRLRRLLAASGHDRQET